MPQIVHLLREPCSAGISRVAYVIWILSSVLLTVSATTVGTVVFVTLGVVQLLAAVTIVLLSARYRFACAFHVSLPVVVTDTTSPLAALPPIGSDGTAPR